MKRLIFLAVLTLVSFSAFAAGKDKIGTAATSSFCDASECGDLPPAPGEPGGTPVGGGGGNTVDTCVKATSYKTCLSRCKCQYDGNMKRCKTNVTCKEITLAEKDACDGGCLSDFTP